MSYMALYRKWRPDAFEEIKGQEHIVTTIRNQIVHDRVGHAYLFCGTRGTGKTTTAKLMARQSIVSIRSTEARVMNVPAARRLLQVRR